MQAVSKQSSTRPSSVECVKKPTSSAAAAAARSLSTHYRPLVPSHDNVDADDDDSESSSTNIGKGGNKFVKKRPQSTPEIPTVQHSSPAAVEKPCQLNVLFHFQ